MEPNPEELHASNKSRLFTKIGPEDIGSMLMYFYDAKWKDVLPYWDMFPVMFVVDVKPDRFSGLNLHYLPFQLRAKLMDALYTIAEKNKENKIQRLALSYQVLKNASKFKAFKPCYKTYLKSNLKSRFFWIEPREWDTALFLRTERFQKATNQTVWRHSREIIKGIR